MAYRASTDYPYFYHVDNYSAAPARDSFAPTDAAELAAIAAEYQIDVPTDLTDAGVAVFVARDEDGFYFACAGDSILDIPYGVLSLEDRSAAIEAARRLATEDAAADRAAGTWPATAARDEYIHDIIPPGNTETAAAYLEAYAAAYEA